MRRLGWTGGSDADALDGHISIQHRIPGAINLAEGARAEFGRDLVACSECFGEHLGADSGCLERRAGIPTRTAAAQENAFSSTGALHFGQVVTKASCFNATRSSVLRQRAANR
jgi:hypothetical protein